jgi:uncharacterized Zn-binding protein involved in type VI secretion
MAAAARGDMVDSVYSLTGSGRNCANPITTATNECSSNVFINAIGAVRIGDMVASHAAAGCGPDTSVLSTSSTTVFINGKGAGRLGDQYTSDNTITSGSPNVFIGG